MARPMAAKASWKSASRPMSAPAVSARRLTASGNRSLTATRATKITPQITSRITARFSGEVGAARRPPAVLALPFRRCFAR